MAWYCSFYWRIAASFAALVVVVLIGQSAIFSYLLTRPSGEFSPGRPNRAAALLAGRVRAALEAGTPADGVGQTSAGAVAAETLAAILREVPPASGQRVYLLLADGREVANTDVPLEAATRAEVRAVLFGDAPSGELDAQPEPPAVTAPVQWRGRLAGLIVMPPPARHPLDQVGRLLSLPGTLLLVAATAVLGAALFVPLRRRLRHLQDAVRRLGAGEPGVRADDTGSDELAALARAFNRMSAELTARTAALHTSNHLRRQMLADVSHELRTPLTSMRGYLDTLALPGVDLDADTRARYLDTARREVGRLERLVTDLLDLARHEHGTSTLEARIFAVERIFEHVVRRHERQSAAAGVTVTMEIAPDVDQIVGDPGRLEQVIENLVANALRHTPAGGWVRLAASAADGGYRLTVEDTGEGIPPEHLPHVFERFYKADHARSGGAGGSGLGLSIARAIVDRHGGALTVESRPGRTVFAVWLPRTLETAAGGAA